MCPNWNIEIGPKNIYLFFKLTELRLIEEGSSSSRFRQIISIPL